MIKSRKNFFVSQIAHGSKDNQRVGWRCIFSGLSSGALSQVRHVVSF
jgi:hypothetical protein